MEEHLPSIFGLNVDGVVRGIEALFVNLADVNQRNHEIV